MLSLSIPIYKSLLTFAAVCKPARGRFPSGYPGAFKGPLRSPYHFPRNRNHPGPKGMGGQAVRSWSRGGGQPYNEWERIRTAIHN